MLLSFTSALSLLCSCQQDWLDEKRDIQLVVPGTLRDLRLMLNNSFPLIYEGRGLLEIAGDDLYLSAEDWESRFALERYAYIWDARLFDETSSLAEWDYSYQQVLIANLVLETLPTLTPEAAGQAEWNALKGAALFYRARAFYNVAQIFAPAYQAGNPQATGIPLRLSSDIHLVSTRASLQQTYAQITTDLLEAIPLLPESSAYLTDPSRPAALGFLARCYLTMGDYQAAWEFADQALALNGNLIDYNELDTAAIFPLPLFSEEVIYHAELSTSFSAFYAPTGKIDDALYQQYKAGDLRKTIFFQQNEDGSFSFKGNYTGNYGLFGGIATDELYLIRAECAARLGDTPAAMQDLNTLLQHRFLPDGFVNLSAESASDAVSLVLQERRKELLLRGLRWTDIRRLNLEPAYAITLVRNLGENQYTLPPKDPAFTFPIPEYVKQASDLDLYN